MSLKKATSVSTENAVHSYSQEEKEAFVDHINDRLSSISQVQDLLPLDFDNESLFTNISDGRLLWFVSINVE